MGSLTWTTSVLRNSLLWEVSGLRWTSFLPNVRVFYTLVEETQFDSDYPKSRNKDFRVYVVRDKVVPLLRRERNKERDRRVVVVCGTIFPPLLGETFQIPTPIFGVWNTSPRLHVGFCFYKEIT